jgi:hypothetical protein
MKHSGKNSRLLLTVLCLLTLSFAAHAQEVEKQKEFNKTYPLHNNQGVSVTNKFGKVEVQSWNQKEVKVAVTIIARAGNDTSAQNILDAITIESKDGNPVTFTTHIEAKNFNNASGTSYRRTKPDRRQMEINYVVYLPESNKLNITNKFGNTFVPNRKGSTNINQSFGDLTLGDLPNADSITQRFGQLTAGTLSNAAIRAAHCYVNIKALSGSINAEFDFCKQTQLGLTNELKKLDADFSFSKNIAITVPPAIDARFNIETRYSKVNNETPVKIVQTTPEKKPGRTIKRTYSGQAGSGKVSIKMYSNFGDILLK